MESFSFSHMQISKDLLKSLIFPMYVFDTFVGSLQDLSLDILFYSVPTPSLTPLLLHGVLWTATGSDLYNNNNSGVCVCVCFRH